jgi:regulator of RNase E activity RraA
MNTPNPTVDFDVDEVCRRFSVIYTGAISDVLDEMGYRHQVLPAAIQGLTIDQKVAGRPIQIGDVGIRRGDFIIGDKDGVVVIPKQITMEVLGKAEEVVNAENLVRKAILQGVHPVDAYRKYGRF